MQTNDGEEVKDMKINALILTVIGFLFSITAVSVYANGPGMGRGYGPRGDGHCRW